MKPRIFMSRKRGFPRMLRAATLLLTMGIVFAGLSASGYAGTASTSSDPAPAPKLAALGDSITAAWSGSNHPAESWSTGTDTAVDSHLQRLADLFGITDLSTMEADNHAASGQSVASTSCGLVAQVNGSPSCSEDSTHAIDALPSGLDYVTIEGGSADLCGADITDPSLLLPAADFGSAVHDALAALGSKLSPTGVVLVASIPNWYGLWQDFPTQPAGPVTSRPSYACPLLFGAASDESGHSDWRTQLSHMNDAYNAQLATVCAAFSFCRYDGGAVNNLRFAIDDLSTVDHFHFSPQGEAKLAAAAWAGGWFNGNDPSITGTAQEGQTLTAALGTWAPAASLARSWWRCPAGSCAAPVQVAGDQATYVPGAADVGSTILVTETATTGFGTARRSSAVTATVSAPPPPPPTTTTTVSTSPPATPNADLALTMTADTSTAGAITYKLVARDANGGNGANVALTVQLPNGVTATSATTDRGAGCSGTTKVTCQLGSFSGGAVANITIVASVTVSQTFTTTASVSQDQADPNGSNNSASLTTTPAAPAARIPTVAFVGTAGKARVSRLNKAILVTGSFTVADALGVEASLVNSKTGKPVAIFAHSRIGSSLTGRTHTSVRSKLDSSSVPISIRAPRDVWVHPGRYALRINAFSATGQSTALSVGVTK